MSGDYDILLNVSASNGFREWRQLSGLFAAVMNETYHFMKRKKSFKIIFIISQSCFFFGRLGSI